MTDQTLHIRRLNDMTGTQPEIVNATWVTTQGVLHLLAGDDNHDDAVLPAPARVAALRAAIATFKDWTEGNDPYGEHDFGAFDLFDQRLFSRSITIIPTTTRSHPYQAASNYAAVSSPSCWLRNIKYLPRAERITRLLRLCRSWRPGKGTAY